MVDGNGLENRRAATYRGFESRPLRHRKRPLLGVVFYGEIGAGPEPAGNA